MYSAHPFRQHFSIHFPCFLFASPFAAIGCSVDKSRMHPNPFYRQKMNLRNTTGIRNSVSFKREEKVWVLHWIFYCRDYAVLAWQRKHTEAASTEKERTERIHLYRGSPRDSWVGAVCFLNDMKIVALNNTKSIPPVTTGTDESHLQSWEWKLLKGVLRMIFKEDSTSFINRCHVLTATQASTDGCDLEINW